MFIVAVLFALPEFVGAAYKGEYGVWGEERLLRIRRQYAQLYACQDSPYFASGLLVAMVPPQASTPNGLGKRSAEVEAVVLE